MIQQPAPRLLPFAILLAILAVSTASILIRLAQQEAPSLVIAAFRLGLAAAILAPLALARHRLELLALNRKELLLAVLSGAFLAIHFATWISSLEYTTVASSVVLVSTGPLWVALLTPLTLREPLGRAVIAGLLLALIGGTAVGLSDACGASGQGVLGCEPLAALTADKAMYGNFLALAGAWAVTGYLLIGRRLRAKMSLVPYVFVVYGMAALLLIAVMFAAGESPLGYSGPTYGWMLLLALIPQLVGHSTYNWALRYVSAALVAVVTLGEPIGSSILAYFILRETPTPVKLVGAAVILVGIYVASRGAKATGQESGRAATE